MEEHKRTQKRAQARRGAQRKTIEGTAILNLSKTATTSIINPNAMAVISTLHEHGKKGMTSWQVKKLAKLHERTAERALKRLAEQGQYIQIKGKTAKNGTIYCLTDQGRELSKGVQL